MYLKAVIYCHDSCEISKAMAIVWCTPHGRKCFSKQHLKAFHTPLMSSCYVSKFVRM